MYLKAKALFLESVYFYILSTNRNYYEAELLSKFSKMPVFSLADVSQIVKSKNYAKVIISRMVKKGKVPL
jgi:hypothetical protein